MDSQYKQTLYIPQGLSTRVEILEGYGKEELYKTIFVTIVTGMIDLLMYLLFRNVVASIVTILVAIFGSVMLLTKDKMNCSVVDQIGFMIRFARSQKIYRYKYLEEWK